MPLSKRKLSSLFSRSTMRSARKVKMPYARRAKRARRAGTTGIAGILRASVARTNRMYNMIETKESGNKTGTSVALNHNTPTLVFDLFENIGRGVEDPMGPSAASTARIGDKITIKGVLIRGMLECALGRSRVHFHLFVVKGAKGDTFDASTLFKGMAGNKMIDQFNTERFTIVASKRITVSVASQPANQAAVLTGEPQITQTTNTTVGGQGVGYLNLWVPGGRICKNGHLIYENNTNQPKFFDYKVVIIAYDWYGTPETSAVGRINEMYHKVYFKDL